ncbi:uncharacterized protein SPPG_00947 [Spizellomyces punctatus DAOM BR117]|uniref:Uncharacterized protein n=1 Tax=Spizellomyces punctatus (strain DAOM BR117) TaxID=645134 RepID=A0A0L0HRG1_SPIPD|nr:uncharacterized protein SPPG_00947 [Spizellomyces punctatus DAOM BR117]KND03464.1 hypothetical protein SPPG_00947 [Spizellomyces punctatus DAOM BR117]|eukprot:XP_016611503.1 hypothetical protein SPPG_00947 [Spizellomyces punctatus DAOM BR117]
MHRSSRQEALARSSSHIASRSGSLSHLVGQPVSTSPTKRERINATSDLRKAQSLWNNSQPSTHPTTARDAQVTFTFKDVPHDRRSEAKVVWTRHFQSEQNMIEQRYENQLPKSSKLIKGMQLEGVAFLQSALQGVFDKLTRTVEQLGNQLDKGDADYLVTRYFNDCIQILVAYLQNCSLDVSEEEGLLRDRGTSGDWIKLIDAVVLWNKVYMRHLDFLRQRDELLEQFTQQFEESEEENLILKDVLTHSSGGRCEVVIKRTFEDKARPKATLRNKSTNAPEEGHPGFCLPSKPVSARTVSALELLEKAVPFASERGIDVSALASALKSLSEEDAEPKVGTAASAAKTVEELLAEITKPMAKIRTDQALSQRSTAPTKMDLSVQTAPDVIQKHDAQSGVDKPIPRFESVCIQADMQHPAEQKLYDAAMRINTLEEKLEHALRKHSEDLTTITKKAEIERQTLKTEYEIEKHRLMQEKYELTTWLQDAERAKQSAANTTEKLEADIANLTRVLDSLSSQNNELNREKREVETSKAALAAELATLKGTYACIEAQYLTSTADAKDLKEKVDSLQKGLSEARKQLADLERERVQWEKTASDAIHAERAAVTQFQEIQEEIARVQDSNQKLSDSSLELERMLQIANVKNKELTNLLNVLMKFPDASLGHDVALSDLPLADEADKILKDMINSNNLRISLLEQKNNEFRVLRLQQSSRITASVQGKPEPKTALYDNHALQRATDAIVIRHLEEQAAIRVAAAAAAATKSTAGILQATAGANISRPRPQSPSPPALLAAWGPSAAMASQPSVPDTTRHRSAGMGTTRYPPNPELESFPSSPSKAERQIRQYHVTHQHTVPRKEAQGPPITRKLRWNIP